MDITICVKGKKFDPDSFAAIAEYKKRMLAFCNFNVLFFKRYKDYPLPVHSHSIGFVVQTGKKTPSSPELSNQLSTLQTSGYSSFYYYIFDDALANEDIPLFSSLHTLSLSSFQMSRHTTTIVLAEQLYRAFTIQNNITYHK